MKTKNSQPDYKRQLRKAGFKVTPARLAILNFMGQSKTPLSAQEIIERLHTISDPVTVYRTINSLKSNGLIRQVDLRHNHAHYELFDLDDHHHVICLDCGRVEDITGCGIEEMQKTILQTTKHFSEIRQHSVEFYGFCNKCLKKPSRLAN